VVDPARLFVYLDCVAFVFANWPIPAFFPVLKSLAGKKYMIASLTTDFLIRLKNGSRAGRKTITAPGSKYSIALATLIKKYGYIDDFVVAEDLKKVITITLAYQNGQPRITDVELFSRPGRRIYEKSFSLPWGKSKNSLIIISTSTGLMSQKEAKTKGLGGEIIAEIY
jgi:small subunit ribosomal protein S8